MECGGGGLLWGSEMGGADGGWGSVGLHRA